MNVMTAKEYLDSLRQLKLNLYLLGEKVEIGNGVAATSASKYIQEQGNGTGIASP